MNEKERLQAVGRGLSVEERGKQTSNAQHPIPNARMSADGRGTAEEGIAFKDAATRGPGSFSEAVFSRSATSAMTLGTYIWVSRVRSSAMPSKEACFLRLTSWPTRPSPAL